MRVTREDQLLLSLAPLLASMNTTLVSRQGGSSAVAKAATGLTWSIRTEARRLQRGFNT